jgi:hypothetical protein
MRLPGVVLLWCCVAASAQAQPKTKVLLVESSSVGVTQKKAVELLSRLEAVLIKEGLAPKTVRLACAGERACLVAAAAAEGQDAVISVSLVMSLKSVIIDLEAVSTTTSTVLAQANFKVKATDASLPDAVSTFARSIGERLDEAKKIVADAPVKVQLEPPAPPPPLEVVIPVTPPSRAPLVLTAVGAGVALVASAILVGVGASTQAQLPRRDSTADALPLDRAQQLVAGANTAYTGAVIAGSAAGALGVTALILGLTSK